MELIKEYGVIVTLIMAILEGIGIYVLWKKMPKEFQNLDADTVQKYADAADRAIELNEKLEIKVAELQVKAERLAAEIESLKKQIGEKDRIITDWAAGIDRLIHQICSLDKVPVWRPGAEVVVVENGNGGGSVVSQPVRKKRK